MAKRIKGHDLGADRYKYDFKLCTSAKGWAQLDTNQDAHYFGNWINPITYELLSYCEGDVTVTKCDDEADFIKEVREAVSFYENNGTFTGIDPGINNPEIPNALERMKLDDLFHGRRDQIWIQYVQHGYPGHWHTWLGTRNSWKTFAYFNTLQEAIDSAEGKPVTILPGRHTR